MLHDPLSDVCDDVHEHLHFKRLPREAKRAMPLVACEPSLHTLCRESFPEICLVCSVCLSIRDDACGRRWLWLWVQAFNPKLWYDQPVETILKAPLPVSRWTWGGPVWGLAAGAGGVAAWRRVPRRTRGGRAGEEEPRPPKGEPLRVDGDQSVETVDALGQASLHRTPPGIGRGGMIPVEALIELKFRNSKFSNSSRFFRDVVLILLLELDWQFPVEQQVV